MPQTHGFSAKNFRSRSHGRHHHSVILRSVSELMGPSSTEVTADLLDELSTSCHLCGRLHIDCDNCSCVRRLGFWTIDGCNHCESRGDLTASPPTAADPP
jgi:hypothetical protein